MKKTKYILIQMIEHHTVTLTTDKAVRFSSRISPRLIRVNSDGEVIISFNEDPRNFTLDEARLDIYVEMKEAE